MTLAHLIAEAAFEEGKWAQAFPAFGVERRGAPVEAFARVDDTRITDRSHIDRPDTVLVQDPSLLEFVTVTAGLPAEGTLVVNTESPPDELPVSTDASVVTVDATDIALEHLGEPIMNTALLGAFARATGLLDAESVAAVIREEFTGEQGDQNVRASQHAYEEVQPA